MSNRVVASALKLLITGTRENQVIVREVGAQPRDVKTKGKSSSSVTYQPGERVTH